jgi:hypothetical protein
MLPTVHLHDPIESLSQISGIFFCYRGIAIIIQFSGEAPPEGWKGACLTYTSSHHDYRDRNPTQSKGSRANENNALVGYSRC